MASKASERGGEPRREADRLPYVTKLSYGLGEMAEGVKSAALETFLFFYYVQVVGLSGSMTGLALLVALLFDGLSDPVIGNVSDNFRSRWGRRHPSCTWRPSPWRCVSICCSARRPEPDRGCCSRGCSVSPRSAG